MSSNNNNEKKSGAPRAVKPGAVAVSADEAARLDQRIAEKRSDTTEAMKDAPAPAKLSQLEQDIAAKQAAKPSPASFTSTPRGAFSQVSSTTERTELSSLESDVMAKQRARPAGRAELTTLESDVSAKQRARPTASSSTPGAVAQGPPGRTELASLESDVAAKQRARSTASSTTPGAVYERTDLASLENDVAAKQRARPTASSTTPGAVYERTEPTDLASLESDVAAKQRARPMASSATPGAVYERTEPTDLASLESDVAAKQRARPTASSATAGVAAKPPGRTELASLESDVAAKQRARPTASSATPGAVYERTDLASLESDVAAKQRAAGGSGRSTAPGAHAELNSFEDSIAAKTRGQTGTDLAALESDVAAKQRAVGSSGRSMAPGAHAELNSLEDSISAKTRGQAGTSAPGSHAKLNALEDSVTAKVRRDASLGAHAELSAMEDAVTAKSRGTGAANPGAHAELSALEDSVVSKQNETGPTRPRQNEISRLDERIAAKTGVPLPTMGTEARADKRDAVDRADFRPHADDKAKLDGVYPEQAPVRGGEKGGMEMLPFGGVGGGGLDQGFEHNPDIEYALGDMQNGLAVAVPVTEEDDDAFIPAAVEYDPDAKPPIYKNRRFRMYAFFACIVLVVVAVGAAVGVTVTKDDGYIAPTSAPTQLREGLGIEEQIERLVGSAALEDDDSPYAKALNWIMFDDPQQLTTDAENFVQRYTAAYFYYATTIVAPWFSCNAPTGNETADCFLQKLIATTPAKYEPIRSNRWLSEASECEWAGVYCDDLKQFRGLEIGKCTVAVGGQLVDAAVTAFVYLTYFV
jgi:hypothetical protein